MPIFIPKKINVGFQNRSDTYSGKLAYVIYFDQKGKLRKEASWQSWRDENIPNEIYDNEPMDGFVLNKKVGGVEECYHYDARKTYVRVYDPRGFEFEITIPNLLWILQNCDCTRGKGLEGQFVYGWDGTELVLVPTQSPDYKEIADKNEVIHNNTFIKPKELICGATYEDLNGYKYVFMGKFKPWEELRNYYRYRRYHDREEKGYDFTPDESWKQTIFLESQWQKEHPTLRKNVQKEKYEYCFVLLGNPNAESVYDRRDRIIFMKTANKKFTKTVCELSENYSEYIDLLNHNRCYSPYDYDSEQIVDLPFENFKFAITQFIDNYKGVTRSLFFGVKDEDWINGKALWFDEKTGMFYNEYQEDEVYNVTEWYINTRSVTRKRYYNSIEEMYKEIKPVYGVSYLANGLEYERKYYHGSEK